MSWGSFLTIFKDILHATEAAAEIAAPIIATLDPPIGILMGAATQAAVGVEAAITTPGSGQQKAGLVAQQTQASIDVVNQILQSQGKKPLPTDTGQVIAAQVGTVIGNLNAIKGAVLAAGGSDGVPQAPAPAPAPAAG